MTSTLFQKLYLGGLPSGLNMTITDVKPSVPDAKKWAVHFSRSDVGSFTVNDSGSHDFLSERYPITVATSTADGLIGEVALDIESPFASHGTGGKVDITIRIQGTTNDVSGNSHTVDQEGYISVTASDWKGTARPDFSYISYHWGDTPPVVFSISVPTTIAGQPADAYFVFGVSADGKQIGVHTTLHKEILNEVTDGLIKGTFLGDEELVGWAMKSIPTRGGQGGLTPSFHPLSMYGGIPMGP